MELTEVDYHDMMTHWTDDYRFEGLMYKLNPESESVVELYIHNNKKLFDSLFEHKDEIEDEIGFEFIWTGWITRRLRG